MFGCSFIWPFTAQLKVNLRPLWSPAAAALAALSQRFGDVVWEIMFSEIQTGQDAPLTGLQTRYESVQVAEEGNDDIWEDERSWRDPSAHKLRVALGKWLDSEYRVKELIKVRYAHLLVMFLSDTPLGIALGGPF